MKIIVVKTQAEIDALQRLISKTRKDSRLGCWEFVGGVDRGGYGKFRLHGKTIGAHRASYILLKGKIGDGKDVAHDCDNPRCLNPLHLRLLSRSSNLADSVKRGRIKTGVNSGSAALTSRQLSEVIRLRSKGWSFKSLGRKLGVSADCVRRHHRRRDQKKPKGSSAMRSIEVSLLCNPNRN